MLKDYPQTIELQGFKVVENLLDEQQVGLIKDLLRSPLQNNPGKNYALRRLLEKIPEIDRLCWQKNLRALIEPILGKKAFPVRGLFFDKTPNSNWGVSWHQDLTIAVGQRIETEGFTTWSVKEEIHHVRPPLSILERMLTLRIHLDLTNAENGALRVIPGSHNRGIVPQQTIQSWKHLAVTPTIPSGGILAMKPLLVHSSQPARQPVHRRVIHIEFAAEELPNGLKWYGC